MTSEEIRRRFLDFFARRGHKIVPSASLVPSDPSVLLTTAGMQQFKPYYTDPAAAERELGSRNVASVQKCFRTSDLDAVGDESHLTFFEMLGNFSFGGYGKKEAIDYAHNFIVKELGLPINYVTVFAGGNGVDKDEESEKIWRGLGLTDIRTRGQDDNFWGPTGNEGPCGPTTEIYVRGMEIWNLVFNEYYCRPDGQLEKLPTPASPASPNRGEPAGRLGVDTGMGLERLAMVVQGTPTIFETDLFVPLLAKLPVALPLRARRIIADHVRGVINLVNDGVRPSNKGAGYILRRLLRRMMAYGREVKFADLLFNEALVVFTQENQQFARSLAAGLRQLEQFRHLDAAAAFRLYETYGLPFEVIREKFPELQAGEFAEKFKEHQAVSRAGLEKKFAGGLADHEPATIKLHTAHHLLLAALQVVLGKQVKQCGSNINQERLRLDFSFDRKLTDAEKKQTEDLVNEKIKEDLAVIHKEMPRSEAEKIGAEMEFGQKYGDIVSVYFVEDGQGKIFSKEFCAGPHVARTGELGHFKILKDEAVAAGIRRIKAALEN
ncbi:MAG: alanine--tRNA ligase [Candidatus Vogelbacteria bacterium]|nr:alanine--tRNA ligase [Candidatus Vogelbacteria bacterium]